jgi:hypothetical protein
VPVSLHRVGRRLYRKLAVRLDRARRLRACLAELIGRRAHPRGSSEIAWLRSYSNYLTPRTGLLSADTWAAIALYVRNLMLNWLVILPALCLFLLGVKTIAILAFWLSALRDLLPLAFVGPASPDGLALRFALLNRPSRDPCTIVGERARGRDKRGYARRCRTRITTRPHASVPGPTNQRSSNAACCPRWRPPCCSRSIW